MATLSFIESPFPTRAAYDAWRALPEERRSAALEEYRATLSPPTTSPEPQQPRAFLVLETAMFEYLKTTEATAYRRAYRNHRLGGAAGARGEAPKEEEDCAAEASIEASLIGDGQAIVGKDDGLTVEGHIFGQGEMYGSEQEFRSLLAWRLAYQHHRSGQARGAKGEIGAGLSVDQVRRLPVARESEYLHARRKKEARALRAAAAAATSLSAAAAAIKPLHIHVGAGRLGLGLVVPALALGSKANEGSLVLLQRPSKAWDALKAGSVALFTVRQELVCRLLVVRDESARAGLAQVEGEAAAHNADGLLVLSEEERLLDELAKRATSLSCSLGPALESGLTPLLSALNRVETSSGRLRLYAGENDHDSVTKLAATDLVRAVGLQVIPLLVDRVCTDRTITESGVDTAAEPWGGEVVVMTPTASDDDNSPDNSQRDGATADAEGVQAQLARLKALPPFAGESVRWPSSAAEAHFLHRRKILTVNGTHTTLAFLALANHEPPPHMGLPKGSHELPRALPRTLAADASDAAVEEELQVEETARMVWSWVVARQLLLLFESSVEVACAALGCQRATEAESHQALADALLAGARVSVERLGTGADSTGRVLGGGVVNRYQTRLKPIASFIEGEAGSKWVRGKLPKMLLRRAKLTETAMRLSVLGLAKDAERFTAVTQEAELKTPVPSPKATPKPSPKPSPFATPKLEAGARPTEADGTNDGDKLDASSGVRRRLSAFFPSEMITSLLGR